VSDARTPGTDIDLVAASRRGDSAALDELVTRYQPRVFRFGVRLCGDAETAADVAQDTLLAMARSLRDFRADASLSTWLYAITHRACLRHRRKKRFQPAREESLDALPPDQRDALAASARDPEQALAGREIEVALKAAIAGLKPAEREVLLLRDVEGLTAPEVGEVLGLGLAAVKSRLHRARLAVRQKLEPLIGTPAAPGAGPCPNVLMLLSRHLEGDLAPATCAEMMAHVERCPRCDAACASLKRVLALCRDAPAPDVPAPLGRAVRDAIKIWLAERPA